MGARSARPEPSRRRRLSAEERRASILTVARHAFAARGYDGVRTQDLAAVAEISEALLYQHFPSKADLYCEVARLSSEAMRDRVAEAAEAAPESERLERALDAFVAFAADGASGWSLLTTKVSDPEIAAYQQRARSEGVKSLVDLLDSELGGSSTAARRRRAEQLGEVLAGGAEALANWRRDHPEASRSEAVSLLGDFAREGLRSLAPAPAARRRARGRSSK